jgi:hypothetical protein
MAARQVTLTRKRGRLQSTSVITRRPPEPIKTPHHQEIPLDQIPAIIEPANLDRDFAADKSPYNPSFDFEFDMSYDNFDPPPADTDSNSNHFDLPDTATSNPSSNEHIYSEIHIGQLEGSKRKRTRVRSSINLEYYQSDCTFKTSALEAWKPHRQEYLEELLRLDGLIVTDGSTSLCKSCGTDLNANGCKTLQCKDCFGGLMYCADCTVKNHRASPFHRIEVMFHFPSS